MFSYRHAFHAGNHADVLKHAVLVQILGYYGRKETPYWVVDTHAGAGLYALDGEWAEHSGEAATGIGKILHQANPPKLIERYLQAVRAFNPTTSGDTKPPRRHPDAPADETELPRRYPGSPALALHAMRGQDRLRLFELHPNEIHLLGTTLVRQLRPTPQQLEIAYEDGFAALPRLLPPPSRRAIIVMDPSYEDKQDYRRVPNALREGLKRFAQGCYLVWYPLVQRIQTHEMIRTLQRLPVRWLDASLTVCKPGEDGRGMHGSGVFIINPPWTLAAELREALPWLKAALGQDDRAHYSLAVSEAERLGSAPAASPRRPCGRSVR